MRQALFPHFIPETQTARGNLATVIQLVPSGDSGKGTSDFQEPGTHVLTLTSRGQGQVVGVFLREQPLPLPQPHSELSAISRARTAVVSRQRTTRQSKRTEIRVCKLQPDDSKDWSVSPNR